MIKVENIDTWGFKHAIRGMRNPMNSWERSDSEFDSEMNNIGEHDLSLMRALYIGGPEHRKYLRQIFVSMDITAPFYWWKEFDTYKVGTVANSCSTMHKIASKEFAPNDFSHEHLLFDADSKELVAINVDGLPCLYSPLGFLKMTCTVLNNYRERYLETKDKRYWWQMIQLLPSSYNQKRTVTMNYENVVNILGQRQNHKLDEWNEFCDILKTLPCLNDITEASYGKD